MNAVCRAEGGETEDEDEVLGDEDDEEPTGARPRRISELALTDKVKPIPLASSLFIFSPTNRSVSSQTMHSLQGDLNLHEVMDDRNFPVLQIPIRQCQSFIFRPFCSIRHYPVPQFPVRYFPVLHCPLLRSRPSIGSPSYSTPATSYVICQSCILQSCKFSSPSLHRRYSCVQVVH